MSRRNGDRARFQKNRQRKLYHRRQIQALAARLRLKTDAAAQPLLGTKSAGVEL
jgi:hypothetical protein